MKMKKIVSLILCCIMFTAILTLSGCSAGGYIGAFDAYMKAEDNVDAEAIAELVHPDLYDYFYNNLKERAEERGEDASDEKITKSVLERFRSRIQSMDMVKFMDVDIVEDLSYTYYIEDEYEASSAEVKEFNDYVQSKLGFKNKAQSIVLIRYRFSMLQNGEVTDIFDDCVSFGMCIKVNGKWYYSEANGSSQIMWIDRDGLTINDCVEWIYDWF